MGVFTVVLWTVQRVMPVVLRMLVHYILLVAVTTLVQLSHINKVIINCISLLNNGEEQGRVHHDRQKVANTAIK